MTRRTPWLALAVALLIAWPAGVLGADLKPHGLFSDHMVLQQGKRVPVWGTADDGTKVTVSFRGQSVAATAEGGKWMAWLAPTEAGGPFEMTIEGGGKTVTFRDVLVGEVWVCSGQSNMAWPVSRSAAAKTAIPNAKNDKIRLFTVERTTSDKPLSAVPAKTGWVRCTPETVPGFSAVGYYFGRALQPAIQVPVGLLHTSWGGSPAQAWTDRRTLASRPELKAYLTRWDRYVQNVYPKQAKAYQQKLAQWNKRAAQAKAVGKKPPRKPRGPFGPNSHKKPCGLYNGMIAPLLPYAIRGAIWYQGEANAGEGYLYRTLFLAMIQNWRKVWKQGDFPFLFVQLAPFDGKPTQPPWAEIRESQLVTTQVCPKTGMAVITDLGEKKDIHPKRKAPVGERLALAARAIAYGQDIVFSGPVYESMAVRDGKVVLTFKHTGSGLVAKGDELKGFSIAGADRQFVPARARIEGDTVVVESPKVSEPKAVRFGWSNFPVVNLFNAEGLPATPFRTDGWPLKTQK